MSDHHESTRKTPEGVPIFDGPDGISEIDNPMPRWMWGVFILTIVWSIGYMILYPGIGISLLGWTQKGEYQAELADAETRYVKAPVAAGDVVGDAGRGKALFDAQCAACHGAGGIGSIGPNLTDATWLYEGTQAGIAHTIAEGTAKGMPPFKAGLQPAQLADLAAYVHGLGGGK